MMLIGYTIYNDNIIIYTHNTLFVHYVYVLFKIAHDHS